MTKRPQKRTFLHIKICLDQDGEGKLVNAGSLVKRLAGDPDLPRLVGRHVDLHAASGCAQRKRWGGEGGGAQYGHRNQAFAVESAHMTQDWSNLAGAARHVTAV